MARKYYAIKKGREIGIFDKSWDEVSKLVQGFQGAVYKSFTSLESAKEWFENNQEKIVHCETSPDTLTAYADGSYSQEKEEYGSGVVLIFPNGKIEEIFFSGQHEEAKSMRNVAGELSASMRAMLECKKRGYKKLILCYDYQGIEKWLDESWKTKNSMTKIYKQWYENNIKGQVEVEFRWVKGHSGDKYNELADKLAKKSLGIGE